MQPPSRSPDTPTVEDSVPAEPELALPEGPVLWAGTRDGDRITVAPVAEIRGDSLLPVVPENDEEYREAFIQQHLREGTEFVLFAHGVRVGRVHTEDVGTDETFCTPRPTGSGMAELRPTAVATERFLALSAERAGSRPYGDFEALEDTYAQRAASVELEIDLLRRLGARFPTGPIVEYRVEIQPLRLGPTGPEAFTTTFVNLDVPRIEPADSAAYASFLLGLEAGEDTYRPAYQWHRSVAIDGKGVPLLWGYMDWDDDGETEILLEVLGAESRWTAAVARRGAEWQRVFQDPCGASSTDDPGS